MSRQADNILVTLNSIDQVCVYNTDTTGLINRFQIPKANPAGPPRQVLSIEIMSHPMYRGDIIGTPVPCRRLCSV
jgi:hypothetical protein